MTGRNLASDPVLRKYYYIMESLTPAQALAWALIKEYVQAHGRSCFTYNSLLRFWRESSTRINANTLERRVRELAALGLLERRELRRGRRRKTILCLPDDLYEYILSLAGGGTHDEHTQLYARIREGAS